MDPVWAWRVLGLPPGSPAAEVKSAFRRAAHLLHPDRVGDLPADVRREAHRRRGELAEAYRVCVEGASRRARVHVDEPPAPGPMPAAAGNAAAMLHTAEERLRVLTARHGGDVGSPAEGREVTKLLEQVAAAWPGTREGDRARLLLVTSVAARSTLSARERAGHLVLVVDPVARATVWDQLHSRDELAIAQVVHAHPTAPQDLHRQARSVLAELGDWASLVTDDDPDVSRSATARLLLAEAVALRDRAEWLSKRERPGFLAEVDAWLERYAAVGSALGDRALLADLDATAATLRVLLRPTPTRAAR